MENAKRAISLKGDKIYQRQTHLEMEEHVDQIIA